MRICPTAVRLEVSRAANSVTVSPLQPTMVWFERRDGDWIPWSVEANHPRHTGAAVVDIDRDGWLDVVVAINTAWDVESRDEGPSLEVYFNRGPRAEPLPADPGEM